MLQAFWKKISAKRKYWLPLSLVCLPVVAVSCYGIEYGHPNIEHNPGENDTTTSLANFPTPFDRRINLLSGNKATDLKGKTDALKNIQSSIKKNFENLLPVQNNQYYKVRRILETFHDLMTKHIKGYLAWQTHANVFTMDAKSVANPDGTAPVVPSDGKAMKLLPNLLKELHWTENEITVLVNYGIQEEGFNFLGLANLFLAHFYEQEGVLITYYSYWKLMMYYHNAPPEPNQRPRTVDREWNRTISLQKDVHNVVYYVHYMLSVYWHLLTSWKQHYLPTIENPSEALVTFIDYRLNMIADLFTKPVTELK